MGQDWEAALRNHSSAADVTEWMDQSKRLAAAGQMDAAEQYLDRILKVNPMEQEVYLLKGLIKANQGELGQAEEMFRNTLKINKNNGLAWFHLGNIESLLGKSAEGIKDLNRALSSGYDTAEVHYHLGLIYEERKDYEEAIRCYNRAVSMDELKKEYRIRKIALQLSNGKIEESLQTLKEYRMIAPEDFAGFHLEAAALTSLGRFDEADQILAEAEKIYPERTELIIDRVRVLASKGDTAGARAELERAQHMELTGSQKAVLKIHEGNILGMQGDIEGAMAGYQEACEPDEEGNVNTEALYYLMTMAAAIPDYERLLTAAKKAEPYAETSFYAIAAPYYMALAQSRLSGDVQEKAYRDAVRRYRTISLKDNSRVDAYLYRALCHKELKEYDRALEMVDYLIRLQPDKRLYVIRGNILEEKGDQSAAQEAYRKAESIGAQVKRQEGRQWRHIRKT